MNLSKYQCPNCEQTALRAESTRWVCDNCGHEYPCVNGIPRLYLENALGAKDKELRDNLYNDLLGKYYQHAMPFLSLPARPAAANWKDWLIYALLVFFLLALPPLLVMQLVFLGHLTFPHFLLLTVYIAILVLLFKYPYFFYLLLLAVPVKLSLLRERFRPKQNFQEIHAEVIEKLKQRGERLQVLDISTGTCNSLYRHGWMSLDADYTGLDLSETMLLQGQKLMAERNVPIELALGDATRLPFASESFDIVLNYGAVNGFTNPQLALAEMARVTKKGGLVLFLDEQLYEGATFIERWYFRKVLSSHNVIHRCPVELIPASLSDVTVHQVYHFYYICTAYKAG